ncbi:MAG TPA: aquaporin [Solirubrobacteraceae bacterium]|nr:aquaporin [Solirubrobacteraceae bacterium]
MEQRGWPAYVAELIGTFLLVFFICLVVTVNSRGVLGVTDWAVIGLVHFLALSLLVAALAGASGAHLNPAVTVALAAMRKIRGGDAAIYILMQFAGGVLAALLVKAFLKNVGRAANYGAPAVNHTFLSSNLAGSAAEAVGTFLLLSAIVGSAIILENRSSLTPVAIGAALGAALLAIGPLTGGSFNPARAFGPALVGDAFNGFGTFVLVYFVGPVVGGLLAAFAIRAIYPGDAEAAEAVEPPGQPI